MIVCSVITRVLIKSVSVSHFHRLQHRGLGRGTVLKKSLRFPCTHASLRIQISCYPIRRSLLRTQLFKKTSVKTQEEKNRHNEEYKGMLACVCFTFVTLRCLLHTVHPSTLCCKGSSQLCLCRAVKRRICPTHLCKVA